MKALVTGGTGFIGLNLINKLVSLKWEVKVLTRSKSRASLFKDKKVQIVLGDLDNLNKIRNKIKQVDIVFNLAGVLPHHHLPDEKYWDTNVKGVQNLLDIYKDSDIKRFVHVSTVGIYGPTPKIDTSESSPLCLDSIYAKTKAVGERLVNDYHKKTGLPTVIIRPTIAYGPGDRRPGFSNLFPLIKKRIFIPVGRGENFFHTIYVGNLIDALLLAASKKNAIGEDFIIGDDLCPTMKKIINTIAKAEGVSVWPFYIPHHLAFGIGKFFDITSRFGIPTILNSQRVKFVTENKKFDIGKARKILGYQAKVGLEEGIKRTYEWYWENKYL